MKHVGRTFLSDAVGLECVARRSAPASRFCCGCERGGTPEGVPSWRCGLRPRCRKVEGVGQECPTHTDLARPTRPCPPTELSRCRRPTTDGRRLVRVLRWLFSMSTVDLLK